MTDSILAFPPGHQFLDGNGDPYDGGKVYIYDAGTTDAQTTYSDSSLSTANSNPLILDSAGRLQSQVYVGTAAWKYVLDTSADVTVHTEDNIKGQTDTSAYLTGTIAPSRAVINKTANYTTTSGDDGKHINCNATGGSFTLTLRSAVSVGDGGDYLIKHDGTANTVTVATTSSQTIDQKTTYYLNPGDSIVVRSDGSNWHIGEAFSFTAGIVTVSFADPLVIDVSPYPDGTNFQVTLTADTNINGITNDRVGMNFSLTIIQDGSGGHTPTFGSAFKGFFMVSEVADAITVLDCHTRAADTFDTRTRGGLIKWADYDLGTIATDGTTETQAHGLGRYPLFVQTFLECQTTQAPYAVGDRVQMNGGHMQRSDGSMQGLVTYFDTTNVYVQYANGSITISEADGTVLILTDASWKCVVRVFDMEPFV